MSKILPILGKEGVETTSNAVKERRRNVHESMCAMEELLCEVKTTSPEKGAYTWRPMAARYKRRQ